MLMFLCEHDENDNKTALVEASQGGYCVVMEELLNNKADVHAKVSLGNTHLHLAAENWYTKAVKVLLNKGADIIIVNFDQTAALNIAYKIRRYNVMKKLHVYAV